MENQIKYPKEVYSAFTSDKTLSVTAHLLPSEGDTSPLKIYQPGKSRFVFSIINTKDKTYPFGNIRIDEIAGILANTNSAHQLDMWAKLPVLHQLFSGVKEIRKMVRDLQIAFKRLYTFVLTGKLIKEDKPKLPEEESLLAKTVIIENGKMKGKTPFQIISEDARSTVDLEKQYEWLKKNLANFPNNAIQMSAIQEALKLHKEGKIHPGDTSSGEALTFGTIALYEPTPRALIREQDENGYCPVYEVAINWHLGERYPVDVRVKRYKAPVVKQESGAINPQRTQATEVEVNDFRLTSAQWLDCTRLMESNMNRFELIMAAHQFRQSEEADLANREASK